MHLSVLLLWLTFYRPSLPFSKPLTPEAQRLQAAYRQLKKEPAATQAQQQFIQAFPVSGGSFRRLFSSADQLSDQSEDYLQVWQQLGATYPQLVLRKSVSIGKALVWEADAVGYLQHSTVVLAGANPRLFAQEARQLSLPKQKKLFRFLADAENHRAYPEYALLITQLQETGATDLATLLTQAKMERMAQQNH